MSDVKNSSLATNLVSYWELEEASGTRVDSTATGNDLADGNTVGQGTGKQGNCADFEKDNTEYLSIADASQTGLDINSDFTFSAWIKFESTPANYCILAKYNSNSGTGSYFWNFDNTTQMRLMLKKTNDGANLDQHTWSGLTAFNTGQWYHMLVTHDISASTSELFIDGVSQGTTSGHTNTAIADSPDAFRVGELRSAVYSFDGLIDEVGIWTRILTSGEIAALYNSGAGIPYEATGGGAAFIPKVTMM